MDELECICASVDLSILNSEKQVDSPEKIDHHSVAKEHRKFTNVAYMIAFTVLEIIWIILYISASVLKLKLNCSVDQKIEVYSFSNISDTLLFLVVTIVDVIKSHWLTLLAPTLFSAAFMYAYLLLVRRFTKLFTLSVFLSVMLATMYSCTILISSFFISSLELPQPQTAFGKASMFLQNPFLFSYFLVIIICFSKTHLIGIQLYKEALNAFFHCITLVLLVAPAFILIATFIWKAILLDCALSSEERLSQIARYFLRGFNCFVIFCTINIIYNSTQIIIVQNFASWYRTKGKKDAPKYEILKDIKTALQTLCFHSGTLVYESLPLVPNVHAFILMYDWKERPSKNFESAIVRFICKIRLIVEINDFVNIFTLLYEFDFDKSARKSINILLHNCTKYIAVLDVFYIIRLWGLSIIVYLFSEVFSRGILHYNVYLMVEDKGPPVEEMNQILIFPVTIIIASLALVIDFIVATGLKVAVMCYLEDLLNNMGMRKKTPVSTDNDSSS